MNDERPAPGPQHEPAPEEDVLDSGEAGGHAIRGGALRTGSYVAGMLLTLAAVPLMLRHLGPEDFARFFVVASIVMLVSGVTEAGLTAIGMREVTLVRGDARRRMVANLVGLRLVLTGVGVLVATVVAALVGYESIIVWGTLVAGLGLLVGIAQSTYALPLAAGLRWGAWSLLDLTKQAATTLLILLLVAVGAGLGPFLAVSVTSSVLVLVLTVALIRRELQLRPSFDRDEWRRLARDTLPYAAAATVGALFPRVAGLTLSLASTLEETGAFGAALQIVQALGGIAWLLVNSAFPILSRAARDDQDRLRYALSRILDVALIAGAAFAVATAVGAPLAIRVIGGDEFAPAVDVLRVQGLALGAGFLVATWATALLSLRRHGDLLRSNGVALVLVVVASAVLVPSYGAMGAAVANVLGEVALAAGYFVLLVRARPDLRGSARVVPALLAASVVALPIGFLAPGGDLVRPVLAMAAFAAVLVVTGAVPPEVRQALTSWRGRRAGPAPGSA